VNADIAGLRARGLALERGGNLLFSGLSFVVPAGTGLVLRGANGSGKTSLLRILAGLTTPDAGEVDWNGQSWRAAGSAQRAASLYVGHANALKDELTAAENLAEALAFDGLAIGAEAQFQALENAGLVARRHVHGRRLSQGQKRRIGLARLSLSNKPVWLLDEPTNALDADGVAIFSRLVREHLNGGGIACIATHVPLDVAAPLVVFNLDEAA
jgi:heme exporter protein A